MHRVTVWLLLALVTGNALAELRPPARDIRPIADPAMVVLDRGAKLEILPNARAIPQSTAPGRVIRHQVIAANAGDAMGSGKLGVLFNHSLQKQGYITGEISFKMKSGHTAQGSSLTSYPGLKRITEPEVYIVNARTPAEFISLLKRLQKRSDVEWAEPTVIYGPQAEVK
jgi:hypothetical protein